MHVTNFASSFEFWCFLISSLGHISIIITVVVVVVVVVVVIVVAVLLSLSQPKWSRQMVGHKEPGSDQGFFPLKGSFFLAAVAKCLLMGECWVSVN